jgi:hypothetical protein
MNLIQKYFRTIPAHITLQQMNININSNWRSAYVACLFPISNWPPCIHLLYSFCRAALDWPREEMLDSAAAKPNDTALRQHADASVMQPPFQGQSVLLYLMKLIGHLVYVYVWKPLYIWCIVSALYSMM